MNRYEKSAQNRDKASRLNKDWGVGAVQSRYRETGDWYIKLARFPAALFDANGYVLFATEEAYLTSPYLQIGKQISVPNGISSMPDYVRAINSSSPSNLDIDIHTFAVTEGQRLLVLHLQRERNQTIVRNKKKLATSLNCEICGFSFARAYGSAASDCCEVHHLLPLADIEQKTLTRMEDLAILCANCHRVIHLRNAPYTLNEVRSMLAK